MKTKLSLTLLLSFSFYLLSSQVPQGFNYQAIARDGSGNILANTPLQAMIYIQSLSTGGTIFWKELHSSVTTNSFGLFTLVIGTGTRQTASTVATFDLIDWSVTPKYLFTQIYYSGSWKDMGTSQLYTVPYAMTAKSLTGTGKLGIKGTTTDLEEAIFEVKNKDGQVIFAVYNEGVRIYVDNGSKGTKGGFAVGGFDQAKTWNQELLRVTGDSTRIYVNQNASKGVKGGFAVGGFDGSKANTVTTFTSLTPQNYFIGHESGIKTLPTVSSGIYNSFFGYQSGKANVSGMSNVFIGYQSGMVNTASNNVFIGYQSGLFNTSGNNNIFLGYQSGYTNIDGIFNTFMGYRSGYYNDHGDRNAFVGYRSGYSNTDGEWNAFFGFQAGYGNTLGNNNSYFGQNTAFYSTTAINNSFFGYEAGMNNLSGSNNTYIGYRAGHSVLNAIAYDNVMIGQDVGYSLSTGHDNISLGNKAGYSLNTGNYNVFVGSEAGYSNQDGQYNTFLGYQAGNKNVGGAGTWEGEFNTFLGYQAGFNSTSGYRNIAIGFQAGFGYTTNRYNVCIGEQSGFALDAGQANVIIGTYTGKQVSSGEGNILLGLESGLAVTTASYNVMLGHAAGRSASGSGNVFIGKYAGYGQSGDNQLVIENNYLGADNATNALIYGDFNSNLLRFNGSVGVNAIPGAAKLNVVDNTTTIAVRGETSWVGSTDHYGIFGVGGGSSDWNHGVYGSASGGTQAFGVWGTASGASSYNVGVFGTASGPGNAAGYFAGPVTVTGAFTNPSDQNLKKDIQPLFGALDKILRVQGVSYLWKSEQELDDFIPNKSSDGKMGVHEKFNFPEGKQIGVIAQDVEKVLPELVQTDADGIKSVDYIKMIPVLIEAMKEQQKMIEELSAEIEQLKNK
ncbi:MAG: tail fiber domain-containing protein [Bacteroidia bacterium]|nr:tail fiber domain-containing protein [Bacteroidia bacterium]